MTKKNFDNLIVGEVVTLAAQNTVYGCGLPTPDGRVYAEPGATGVCGAVKVPAVTERERNFVCVDLTDYKLVDCKGNPFEWTQSHPPRVGAFIEELV